MENEEIIRKLREMSIQVMDIKSVLEEEGEKDLH